MASWVGVRQHAPNRDTHRPPIFIGDLHCDACVRGLVALSARVGAKVYP